jgi:hypothetical protein
LIDAGGIDCYFLKIPMKSCIIGLAAAKRANPIFHRNPIALS